MYFPIVYVFSGEIKRSTCFPLFQGEKEQVSLPGLSFSRNRDQS